MPDTFHELRTKKPLFNVKVWLCVTIGLYSFIALLQAVVGLWIIPGLDLIHGTILTAVIISLADDNINYRRVPVHK